MPLKLFPKSQVMGVVVWMNMPYPRLLMRGWACTALVFDAVGVVRPEHNLLAALVQRGEGLAAPEYLQSGARVKAAL